MAGGHTYPQNGGNVNVTLTDCLLTAILIVLIFGLLV